MEVLILNLYFELLKTPVFTVEDVNKYYDNMDSARSAIKRLMKEGMVAKIRNNMYTCISGETGAPVANRFQIASKITPTSYVSHHTAMEYYGITSITMSMLHQKPAFESLNLMDIRIDMWRQRIWKAWKRLH